MDSPRSRKVSGAFLFEVDMTPEQFCYWLQGFAELSKDTSPSPEQWKSICEHIGTVFKKVTPPVSTAPYQQLSVDQWIRDREKSLAPIDLKQIKADITC